MRIFLTVFIVGLAVILLPWFRSQRLEEFFVLTLPNQTAQIGWVNSLIVIDIEASTTLEPFLSITHSSTGWTRGSHWSERRPLAGLPPGTAGIFFAIPFWKPLVVYLVASAAFFSTLRIRRRFQKREVSDSASKLGAQVND